MITNAYVSRMAAARVSDEATEQHLRERLDRLNSKLHATQLELLSRHDERQRLASELEMQRATSENLLSRPRPKRRRALQAISKRETTEEQRTRVVKLLEQYLESRVLPACDTRTQQASSNEMGSVLVVAGRKSVSVALKPGQTFVEVLAEVGAYWGIPGQLVKKFMLTDSTGATWPEDSPVEPAVHALEPSVGRHLLLCQKQVHSSAEIESLKQFNAEGL